MTKPRRPTVLSFEIPCLHLWLVVSNVFPLFFGIAVRRNRVSIGTLQEENTQLGWVLKKYVILGIFFGDAVMTHISYHSGMF